MRDMLLEGANPGPTPQANVAGHIGKSPVKRSRNSHAFSRAALLAVLSNTHQTSSAPRILRIREASAVMNSSPYLDQYFRGDPCRRKYATFVQPAVTIPSGTGGGSAATRAMRYRSR